MGLDSCERNGLRLHRRPKTASFRMHPRRNGKKRAEEVETMRVRDNIGSYIPTLATITTLQFFHHNNCFADRMALTKLEI